MSRVALVAMPFAGHGSVVAHAASALRLRGHDVLVAYPQGAPSSSLAGDVATWAAETPASMDESGPESVAELRDPVRRAELLEGLQLATLPREVAALERALREHRPDVVLSDPMSFAGAIVATRMGLPWLALGSDFSLVTPYASPDPFGEGVALFEPALRAAMASLSYEGDFRAALAISPHGNLVPGLPGWFDARHLETRHAFPFTAVGMPALAAGGTLARTMPGAPLVLVVFGTTVVLEPSFVASVLALANELPHVEFLCGARTDHAAVATQLGSLPRNVSLHAFVPQLAALEAAEVVVHHGGANSLLEAAHHGVPQVVVPLHSDQFGNAALGERLGLARHVDARTVEPVPAALTEAVRRALPGGADHGDRARRAARDEAQAGLRGSSFVDAIGAAVDTVLAEEAA